MNRIITKGWAIGLILGFLVIPLLAQAAQQAAAPPAAKSAGDKININTAGWTSCRSSPASGRRSPSGSWTTGRRTGISKRSRTS